MTVSALCPQTNGLTSLGPHPPTWQNDESWTRWSLRLLPNLGAWSILPPWWKDHDQRGLEIKAVLSVHTQCRGTEGFYLNSQSEWWLEPLGPGLQFLMNLSCTNKLTGLLKKVNVRIKWDSRCPLDNAAWRARSTSSLNLKTEWVFQLCVVLFINGHNVTPKTLFLSTLSVDHVRVPCNLFHQLYHRGWRRFPGEDYRPNFLSSATVITFSA